MSVSGDNGLLLAFEEIARAAVRRAGHEIIGLGDRGREVAEVKVGDEPVTHADRRANDAILETIRKAFPAHGVVSEEAAEVNFGAEYTWYVDPLDGTRNYMLGIPSFCVALAICRGEEPLVGAIHEPSTNETFVASRAGGCTANGKRVSVSSIGTLSQAIVAMSSVAQVGTQSRLQHAVLDHVSRHAAHTRVMGSTLLELAYVAAGRLDGRIKLSGDSWDFWIARAIVEPSGGCVKRLNNDAISSKVDFVASNRLIHADLVDLYEACAQEHV